MKLFRQILALSIPAIVANLATPLMSMSDMAISGRMGSAGFIAAVALGGVIFNLLYWLLGFLRMGTSGLTAQAFGAGRSHDVAVTLVRSLAVALVFGALIVALQRPLITLLLRFMDAGEDVYESAWRYCTICIWGAPAVLAASSFAGWYVGVRNARLPMLVTLGQVILNIALSASLVFLGGMKVEGLAWGTMVAQWAAAIVFAVLTFRKIRLPRLDCLRNLAELKRFFRINLNIFLRTVCMVAVTFWFTRTGASQSAVVLAANALIMQLFTLFSYFMDGFAYAAEGICGGLAGARDYQQLGRARRLLYAIGASLAAVCAVVYFTGGDLVIGLLSHDYDVNSCAAEYLIWAATIPLAGFAAFIGDGIAVGLIRTGLMLASLVAATAVFFLTYFLLFPSLANHGLWIAFILYLAVRSVIMVLGMKNDARP